MDINESHRGNHTLRSRILIGMIIVAAAVLMYGIATMSTDDATLPQNTDSMNPDATPSETIHRTDYDVILDAAADIDDIIIPDRVSDSNNAFAVNFYRQISDSDENLFFSPISMYLAFSALYEGAGGETAEEIGEVFGLESDDALRAAGIAGTMSSINRDDPHATLNVANAIWLFSAINESYADVVRKVYGADIENAGSDPVSKINGWALEKTDGKITEIVKSGDFEETVMVITNAIYFKGAWLTQFSEDDTAESDFWINGADSVRTDFMNMENKFGYVGTDDIQAIRLPYEGDRLSMLVILPYERDGIDGLQESISAEQIQQWNDMMSLGDVTVKMPKFTMHTGYDLKNELLDLGIEDVFDVTVSDLSGIDKETLHVSKATQKAFVDVNEEGTKAAAVTTMWASTENISISTRFIADHPFIFIIQDDQSDTILFMGRVSDPTM